MNRSFRRSSACDQDSGNAVTFTFDKITNYVTKLLLIYFQVCLGSSQGVSGWSRGKDVAIGSEWGNSASLVSPKWLPLDHDVHWGNRRHL